MKVVTHDKQNQISQYIKTLLFLACSIFGEHAATVYLNRSSKLVKPTG